MSEVEKTNLGWSYIEYQVDKICEHIFKNESSFDVVVGISRGGLVPAVMISHRLNLPLLTMSVTLRDNLARVKSLKINRGERALVVDDINDSGTTFKVISDVFRDKRLDFKTVAIINKKSSHFSVDFFGEMFYYDDWINFPWENK